MLFICRFKVISREDKKQYMNSKKMNAVLFVQIRRRKRIMLNFVNHSTHGEGEESMQ